MPKRDYNIFSWGKGQTIDERFEEFKSHNAHINVLGVRSDRDKNRCILEIADKDNLYNSALFEVTTDREGIITNFKACADFRLYSNIKFSDYTGDVSSNIVRVMGNDLGETLYGIQVKYERSAYKDFELEIRVSPTEELSYTQGEPFETDDEDDA